MRKGVRADSRLDFHALFYDGGFDHALTQERAGDLNQPLEMVRRAPFAVNKQPRRVVRSGSSSAHFFEKRSKGYVNESGQIERIE